MPALSCKRSETAGAIFDQYVYGDDRYVYLRNGVVTSIHAALVLIVHLGCTAPRLAVLWCEVKASPSGGAKGNGDARRAEG
jgi:hypothetical protein